MFYRVRREKKHLFVQGFLFHPDIIMVYFERSFITLLKSQSFQDFDKRPKYVICSWSQQRSKHFTLSNLLHYAVMVCHCVPWNTPAHTVCLYFLYWCVLHFTAWHIVQPSNTQLCFYLSCTAHSLLPLMQHYQCNLIKKHKTLACVCGSCVIN